MAKPVPTTGPVGALCYSVVAKRHVQKRASALPRGPGWERKGQERNSEGITVSQQLSKAVEEVDCFRVARGAKGRDGLG